MFGRFKIKGSRPHIRTMQEMAQVDKAKADEAFKCNKQQILDEFLLAQGFVKYKTKAYVRRSRIDVLEYIDVQKERYGSKTFTVNYSIMPLYLPHNHLVIGFGDRLGMLVCGKDTWWDYANEEIAKVSFQNVKEAIERFVLPWFEKYTDEKFLMKKLQEDKKKWDRSGSVYNYKNDEWICALERGDDRESIIAENMVKLELPKTLMQSER